MRLGREAWILCVLIGFFVVATAYLTQRGAQNQQREQPTTYSVGRGGTRALFELLGRQGFQAERFERPYTRLPANSGLLVMFEPLPRDLAEGEQNALWKWVENGGSFLLVVSKKGIGQGVGLESVAANSKVDRPGTIPVKSGISPLLQDVGTVWVEGDLRLDNRDKKKQKSLVSDSQGDYAIAFPRGKGAVTIVTEGLTASNAQLSRADNAVLFVNIAREYAKGGRKVILFDEYHQGFGYETAGGSSLWQAMGAPLRSAVWYLAAVCVILIYSLNRRFGAPIDIAVPNMRPSTEYIASMAGFYQRAQAADIPFEVIYHAFIRDLASRVDASPDMPTERLAEMAARRYGWTADPLKALFARAQAALAPQSMSMPAPDTSRKAARAREIEVFHLAQQIQDYRRKAELVRLI